MALRGTRVDNFHELLCLVLQEDWAFEFYQPVLTKITWAGLNSL